ncbi:DNA damage tolerance protein RHC31 [Trichoderma asperellum]|uniref:Ubiquitin-like 1-activating enzyme E1A n=1 Tax=Trichoderma asperellum TaxID=101201 RepID=A0A6V8R2N5_TRIAP|nr:DNA damage tolerance protein RHC31 [Trichoderma asperellum]
MEHQPNNGVSDGSAAPIPATNGGTAALNPSLAAPDAMAAAMMMSGQAFIPDPSLGTTAISDPSIMAPMMFSNGHAAAGLALPDKAITADEIALYDRQIRLWGMAAQAKIQNANILLITIRALANEIAKNLVLAGVGSLTVLDSATVTEADLGAQFLLSEVENPVGQNRAEAASVALRKLNPRVQVVVDSEGVKSKGPSYFANFDIIIATDLDPDSFNLINTATRINGKAFYAAGTHGMYGFIFSDLIEHDYVIERDLGNVATELKQETRTRSIVDVKTKKEGPKVIESVTKRELYSTWFLASDVASLPEEYTKSKRRLKSVTPTLSCLRALWEFMQIQGGRLPSNREDLKLFTQIATQKHKALSLPSETLKPEFLRSFLQNLGSEIAPVTAILGGQLAQDVINVLGQKQQPIQNMVIFDGTTMEALMYPLHPEGILGANLLSLGGGVDPLIPNGGMMLPPDMSVALGGHMVIPPLDPSALAAHPHGMPMGDLPAVTNAHLQAQPIAAATQAPNMPVPEAVPAPPAPPATQPQQQAGASASSDIPTEAPAQDTPAS